MKIKLFLTAILMIPLLLWGQCEVFIEPGSVVVTDNGSGVKFEFDITNNSPTEWFGDDLKLAWTLNSGAPIWNIDYTQNTNAGPIIPGETRNIKTPWFDIPNLPSWYPIPPVTYGDPWVESLEWPYWSANPDGFDGNWSPFNLRLGSCGMADGTWVYDGGELYYGPTNTDCPDVNNDAFCDCDVDFVDFNPITYDVSIVIISQQNCGQSLNNGPTSNMDDIGMLQIATHVPGWDFDWGCVNANYHPGWTFDNPLSGFALNSYSNGDTINYNLFSDDSIYDDCFQELLESDTLSECLEIVLWQINYSQTLLVEDGGWASTCGTCSNQAQEYPDINVEGNSINVCDFLPAPPDLIGVSVNITDQYCSLIGDTPTYQIQVTLTNIGMGDVASFCLLPEIGNNTFCFNGEINPGVYIEPGDTITITGDVQVPNGWVDGEDNSITILSVPNETLISNNNFSFSMGESLECIFPPVIDIALDTILYEVGCDEFGAYWNPTFYLTNEGDTPITEFCIVEDIVGTLAPNDTVCFDSYTILPGETYEQGWPNMYEWGVLSVRVIDVNGPSGVLWNDFGFDEDIGDNMYVQIITDTPECVLGCTIVQACNYNPEATINDGSCDFESCVGCMDPEASNYDPTATINSQGLCVYDVLGCTDTAAINYNPLATIDDGSCIEPIIGCMIPEALNYNPLANTQCMPWTDCCIFPIEGCTDGDANNYDPLANIDDGSCTYDVFGCTDIDANNYNLEATEDDGSCEYDIYGCTDVDANNYNPEANIDDESCLYDVFGCTDSSALNYNPLANIDDGNCEYDVFGCTDSIASNYNPLATVDDGSCFIYLGGCTDLDALNYNPMATEDDGSCVYSSCDGEYFAPNTFTPNNDGLNDGWSIVTDSECWRDFQVLIYNRWGGLVWESNIVGEVWEGSNSNGGYYVADGIYIYTVRGVGYNQNHTFNISGYITIFR
tara:strand:+ start:1479 stop:4337 length:2859 start_codon:yes stop_codon:yes gene_type:complete